MENKPIIRHCRNCKWGCVTYDKSVECSIKYERILFNSDQRLTALFCRFYKKKENDNGKC